MRVKSVLRSEAKKSWHPSEQVTYTSGISPMRSSVGGSGGLGLLITSLCIKLRRQQGHFYSRKIKMRRGGLANIAKLPELLRKTQNNEAANLGGFRVTG